MSIFEKPTTQNVYVDKKAHDVEIKNYRSMLTVLGVRFQEVGKKYTLEKRVTAEQQQQINQLIQIIKNLESKSTIKIDNKPSDTSELEKLWMEEFNITPAEVTKYVNEKTGTTNKFLSKYIQG